MIEPSSSGFGPDNLPYGVVALPDRTREPAVRLNDSVVRLPALADADLLGVDVGPPEAFRGPDLNPLLRAGREVWDRLRHRLRELVDTDRLPADAVRPLDQVTPVLPIRVGDYVDMYSSIEHATNVGAILRPGTEPLFPNWRHLPVGYHGRTSTIVVSGTDIRRPVGQLGLSDGVPAYGPEPDLDFELELGFIVGDGPEDGRPVTIDEADRHIFGFVLVNDWSARRIQRWEAQPLGPFLGKSFATSVTPWIVPLPALAPYRVPGPVQEPAPLPHLATDQPWAFDIDLEVELRAEESAHGAVITRTNSRGLYWNPAQQLAHATSNGAPIRAGDLFATGTISRNGPDSQGCLLELTRGGSRPIAVGDRELRYLLDGDTIVMRGQARNGQGAVSFGEVTGTVRPALTPSFLLTTPHTESETR